MRARWWVFLSCLLAALAFGVSACGDDDDDGDGEAVPGGEAQLDLVIGELVPLTGALAPFGPPGEKAGDLALDQINAAIDEVGADHTVEILVEDTETDPAAGVAAARSMVGDDATCLAGAWASGVTIPVGRAVSTREEVLQISPASTSNDVTELDDDGLINRTAAADRSQGPVLADLVEQELGGAEGTVVNVGARNDPYGTGLADDFRGAWEEKGGEVGQEVVYDPEQPTFDSEAQRIVSGNPDGFVIVDFFLSYNKLGASLVRTGDWDASRTFVTDGLALTQLPRLAGEEATEGLFGTAPGSESEAFDQLFEEAPGPARQTFDGQNFDAVILCYLAAVAAGSTEGVDMAEQLQGVTGPPGTKYTFEDLPEAIEALQNGEDIDYDGVSSPIDLDDAGDPAPGTYNIFTYRNGELEIIDTVPGAIPDEPAGGGGAGEGNQEG